MNASETTPLPATTFAVFGRTRLSTIYLAARTLTNMAKVTWRMGPSTGCLLLQVRSR